MKRRTNRTKPPKHHSRMVNLMALAAMLWGAFTLSASTELGPVEKLLVGYVSWGMMIYLLMGFLFARRPSRSIALLGGVAALGAELGHFDLASLASFFNDAPFFLILMIPFSMLCYLTGILAGWGLEILLKALWKRVSISVVHMWSGSDSGAPVEA